METVENGLQMAISRC